MNSTLGFRRPKINGSGATKLDFGKRNHSISSGFTFVELLIVISVVVILGAVFMPALLKTKGKSQRILCSNNLRHIGLAFSIFSTDTSNSVAMVLSSIKGGYTNAMPSTLAFNCFLSLSNEMSTPNIFACPSDKRVLATTFTTNAVQPQAGNIEVPFAGPHNLSYFVGINESKTSLAPLVAGDRNLMISPAEGVINPHTNMTVSVMSRFGKNSTAAWWSKEMHKDQGNIVMWDGSVQQFSSASVKAAINQSNNGNRTILWFPGDETKP